MNLALHLLALALWGGALMPCSADEESLLISASAQSSLEQPMDSLAAPGDEGLQSGGLELEPDSLDLLNMMKSQDSPIQECTPSAACALPEWGPSVDAVGAIYVTSAPQGYCTATLIHGPDGRPHLLTAYHCWLGPEEEAYTIASRTRLRHYNMVFGYQTPCGSDETPEITRAAAGFKLVAYEDATDMLLLKPYNPLPPEWNLTLLGYDSRAKAVSKDSGYTLFHHPAGGPKRWSNASAGALKPLGECIAASNQGSESQYCPDTHFTVAWDNGFTYPGSSGSSLLNSETGRVVATLTGDTASQLLQSLRAPCRGDPFTGGERLSLFARVSAAWKFFSRAFGDPEDSEEGAFTDTVPYVVQGPGLWANLPLVVLRNQDGSQVNITIGFVNPDIDEPVPVEIQVIPLDDILNDLNNGDNSTAKVVATPSSAELPPDGTATITISIAGPWTSELPRSGFVRFLVRVVPVGYDDEFAYTIKGIVHPNADKKGLADLDLPYISLPPSEWVSSGLILDRYTELPLRLEANESAYADPKQPLAAFELQLAEDTVVNLTICLRPGLSEATSIVVLNDFRIVSALSRDDGSDSCLELEGGRFKAGRVYRVAAVDSDVLAAILPESAMLSAEATAVKGADFDAPRTVPTFVSDVQGGERR